jgi:hypothetical protein
MPSVPKIRLAPAPKGLNFFQPLLRGFITVERLFPEVEKEGFFSRHLPRPEAVLDVQRPWAGRHDRQRLDQALSVNDAPAGA